MGPMMRRATGSTNSAAMSACSVPETTFSSATSQLGMGASRRSSISREKPKSVTMGSATDCTAASASDTASTPGSSADV